MQESWSPFFTPAFGIFMDIFQDRLEYFVKKKLVAF